MSERQSRTGPDIHHTALIVIDMQNGFLEDQAKHVIGPVAELVGRWSAAKGPLVFTRFVNAPGSPFERLLGWTRVAQPPDTEIVHDLKHFAARADLVIDKPAYTMLTPAGRAELGRREWSDLVFCGVDTDSCVLKSALDAFEAGYTPWIVTDATASSGGSAMHHAGLQVAGRSLGRRHLIPSSTVFEALDALPASPATETVT